MTYNSYTIYITQVAHIRIYVFGILDLVGHRHFLEVPFTLTMSIEIETDRGNAMGLKGVGNQLEQRTILGTSEPMAKNDHRTLFSRFEYRLLKNGLQLSLRTINSYSFFYRMAT